MLRLVEMRGQDFLMMAAGAQLKPPMQVAAAAGIAEGGHCGVLVAVIATTVATHRAAIGQY
jgi:hypothetical protein